MYTFQLLFTAKRDVNRAIPPVHPSVGQSVTLRHRA